MGLLSSALAIAGQSVGAGPVPTDRPAPITQAEAERLLGRANGLFTQATPDYRGAIPFYREVLSREGGSAVVRAEAQFFLARSLELTGQPNPALEAFQAFIRNPSTLPAHFRLEANYRAGVLALEAGQAKTASDYLQAANDLLADVPANPAHEYRQWVQCRLGDARRANNQQPMAIEAYRAALGGTPPAAVAQQAGVGLALSQAANGDFRDAIATLEPLSRGNTAPAILNRLRLAQIHREAGQPADSFRILTAIAALDPSPLTADSPNALSAENRRIFGEELNHCRMVLGDRLTTTAAGPTEQQSLRDALAHYTAVAGATPAASQQAEALRQMVRMNIRLARLQGTPEARAPFAAAAETALGRLTRGHATSPHALVATAENAYFLAQGGTDAKKWGAVKTAYEAVRGLGERSPHYADATFHIAWADYRIAPNQAAATALRNFARDFATHPQASTATGVATLIEAQAAFALGDTRENNQEVLRIIGANFARVTDPVQQRNLRALVGDVVTRHLPQLSAAGDHAAVTTVQTTVDTILIPGLNDAQRRDVRLFSGYHLAVAQLKANRPGDAVTTITAAQRLLPGAGPEDAFRTRWEGIYRPYLQLAQGEVALQTDGLAGEARATAETNLTAAYTALGNTNFGPRALYGLARTYELRNNAQGRALALQHYRDLLGNAAYAGAAYADIRALAQARVKALSE